MNTFNFQSAVLLGCTIMYLTGGVVLLHCPNYMKHEAIREGLLNERALCNAVNLSFTEEICLNGQKSQGHCSSGGCNWFGYNCHGHCITGNNNMI